jgi:choice-of-anchor A domain-containing protein
VGSTTPPIDFTAAAASLTTLSASLKNLTANGTVTGGNNYGYTAYTLTATNCTVCVFNMPGGTINSVTINAPTGATVVVNVSGASSTFTNGSMNYTGGATAATTIFNFNAATAISTMGLGFNGSILAPLATFSGQNGNMNGELIAKTVSGQTGQFDSGDIFRGDFGFSTTGATPPPLRNLPHGSRFSPPWPRSPAFRRAANSAPETFFAGTVL